jgi:hypothetical protein
MIQISDRQCAVARHREPAPAAGGSRQHRRPQPGGWHLRRAGCGALTVAVLLAGCAGGHRAPAGTPPRQGQGPGRAVPAAAEAAGSLVRVPRPDYADPASVAAAFYTAWASVDPVHDAPLSFAARCAPLATPALAAQLAASQLPAAAWQQMRREHLASLVSVDTVTRPDGAPATTGSVAYLRVYATRVTISTAGRDTSGDGTTLQLTRTGGRWLVSAVLFW